MAINRTIDLLPEYFRSIANQRFLNSTLDRLVSDPVLRSFDGYVGRRIAQGRYLAGNYLNEPSFFREKYQLEPEYVYRENGVPQQSAGFLDLLNSVAIRGGQVGAWNRLLTGDSYSYRGFVDLDKLTNYYNYVWIPEPRVINNSLVDENPWFRHPVEVSNSSVPSTGTFNITRTTRGLQVEGYDGLNPTLNLVRNGEYTFNISQAQSQTALRAPKTIYQNNNSYQIQARNEQARFNTTSGYFSGTQLLMKGPGLATNSSPDFNFKWLPFTVECWIRIDSASDTDDHVIVGQWKQGENINNSWALIQTTVAGIRGVKFVWIDADTSEYNELAFNEAGVITNATWHHVAVTRLSNTVRLYVDGELAASTYISTIARSDNRLTIGVDTENYQPFKGYIDDLRISLNIARYASLNYDLPTENQDNDANTVLLINFDSWVGDTNFYDNVQPANSRLWIQSYPGLDGIVPYNPNLDARDILGVDNNGQIAGTILFNVPALEDESYYRNLKTTGIDLYDKVDLATKLNFNQINNAIYENFIKTPVVGVNSDNNGRFGGIDGIKDLDGKTLIFTNEQTAGWERDVPIELQNTEISQYDQYSAIVPRERFGIWQIRVIKKTYEDGSTLNVINLFFLKEVDQDYRVDVENGVDFRNTSWYKTSDTSFFYRVPQLSGNYTTLYLQDDQNIYNTLNVNIINTAVPELNVDKDIVCQPYFVAGNGVELIDGLHIKFGNDCAPASYTDKTLIDRVLLSSFIDEFETQLTLSDVNFIQTGDYLKIEDELMVILTINRSTQLVTVDRAQLTTAASPHSDGTLVQVLRTRSYIVEGVGNSIVLVPYDELTTPESYLDIAQDPDYITVNRSSLDRNPWSRTNRWFNRQVVDKSIEYLQNQGLEVERPTKFYNAVRPIVEFQPGLALYDFGSQSLAQVDVIDNTINDALSNVNGRRITDTQSITVDGHLLQNLDLVVFNGDKTAEVRNKVYQVEYVDVDGDYQAFNKASVKLATTANIDLSAAWPTPLEAGDRVLVWKQNDARQNGIYRYTGAAFVRASDADSPVDYRNDFYVYVTSGTYADTWFRYTTVTPSRLVNAQVRTAAVATDTIALGSITGITVGMAVAGTEISGAPTVLNIDTLNLTVTLSSSQTLSVGANLKFSNFSLGTDFIMFETATDAGPVVYLREYSTANQNSSIVINNGVEYRGTNWRWDAAAQSWIQSSQEKIQTQQKPLFNVFDYDRVAFDDAVTYPSSNFQGSTLFEYTENPNTTRDGILGFGLTYRNINNVGDISFSNSFVTDSFSYQTNTVTGASQTVAVNTGVPLRLDPCTAQTEEYSPWQLILGNLELYQNIEITGADLTTITNLQPRTVVNKVSRGINVTLDNVTGIEAGMIVSGAAVTGYPLVTFVNADTNTVTIDRSISLAQEDQLVFNRGLQYNITGKLLSKLSDLSTKHKMYVDGRQINFRYFTVQQQGNQIHFEIASAVLDPNNNYYTPIGSDSQVLIKVLAAEPIASAWYDVPDQFEINPFNELPESFTLSDLKSHTDAIHSNHGHSVTSNITDNNLNDNEHSPRPGLILLHEGFSLLPTLTLTDVRYDIEQAIKNAGKDYEQFKLKFLAASEQVEAIETLTAREAVDSIFAFLNANNTANQAWYTSDMIPVGGTVIKYVIEDLDQTAYNISKVFTNKANNCSVLLYINSQQLVRGVDYEFSADKPLVNILRQLKVNDILEIVENTNTNGSCVPATPAKLGLGAAYVPEIYIDDTYREPVQVIQGHDGSITRAYEDYRDQLLLEMELRIYNNIKVDSAFWNSVIDSRIPAAGKFRDLNGQSLYGMRDQAAIQRKLFYEWVAVNRVTFSTSVYDSSDTFSYNYSQTRDVVDGSKMLGYWRGIYREYYDTDRPHTHPWELAGFTVKPSWWQELYGPAPYTAGNNIMWQDLMQGYASSGHWHSARGARVTDIASREHAGNITLLDLVPVDESGNLLSPNDVMSSAPVTSTLKNEFTFNDNSPAETAWRRRSEFAFALLISRVLSNPQFMLGTLWDLDNYKPQVIEKTLNPVGVIYTDWRYQQTQYPSVDFVKLHNVDTDSQGQAVFVHSILNYVVEALRARGEDPAQLRDSLNNFDVNLVYKMAAFADSNNVQVYAEQNSPQTQGSSVKIPQEDYDLLLGESVPLDVASYSGVIVSKTDRGYQVNGYDQEFPYFIVYPSNTKTKPSSFTVGSQQFTYYTQYLDQPIYVPYNYEFYNKQTVVDFLLSYGEHLKRQGFVFDTQAEQERISWADAAIQFLKWSGYNWNTGNGTNQRISLVLNPASAMIKFKPVAGTLQNLARGNNLILDENQLPIIQGNLDVFRDTDLSYINNLDPYGTISALRTNIVTYEHKLVMHNSTVFNDLIYNPALGIRQNRLRIQGVKTNDWDGTINSAGYLLMFQHVPDWQPNTDYLRGDIVKYKNRNYTALEPVIGAAAFQKDRFTLSDTVYQNRLMPSIGAKALELQHAYDLNYKNSISDMTRLRSETLGYVERTWLANLGLDLVNQTEFYRGWIKEKGSQNAITKFTSAGQQDLLADFSISEEYAIKLGEYGSTGRTGYVDVPLINPYDSDNPLAVEFAEGDDTANVIRVRTSDLYRKDRNWQADFIQNSGNLVRDELSFLNAGPVLPQEIYSRARANVTEYTPELEAALTFNNLASMANTSDPVNLMRNVRAGNWIWIAVDENSTAEDKYNVISWRSSQAKLLTVSKNVPENTLDLYLDRPINVTARDVVAVDLVDGALKVQGVFVVKDYRVNPTSLGAVVVSLAVPDVNVYNFDTVNYTTETAFTPVYTYSTLHHNDIGSADLYARINKLKLPVNTLAYVDYDVNGWAVYQYQEPYNTNDNPNLLVRLPKSQDNVTFAQQTPITSGIATDTTDGWLWVARSQANSGVGEVVLREYQNATLSSPIDAYTRAVVADYDAFFHNVTVTSNGASSLTLSFDSATRPFSGWYIKSGAERRFIRTVVDNGGGNYTVTLETAIAVANGATASLVEGIRLINVERTDGIRVGMSILTGKNFDVTATAGPNTQVTGVPVVVEVNTAEKFILVDASQYPLADKSELYFSNNAFDTLKPNIYTFASVRSDALALGTKIVNLTGGWAAATATDSGGHGQVHILYYEEDVATSNPQVFMGTGANYNYGTSIAASDDGQWLVVGEPRNSGSGRVYVYYRFGDGATASASLTGNGSSDTFALGFTPKNVTSCLVTVAGVYKSPGYDYNISGSNIVFTSIPANGAAISVTELTNYYGLVQTITDPDAASGAKFGYSVGVNSDASVITVGSPLNGVGKVYVFSRDIEKTYVASSTTTLNLGGTVNSLAKLTVKKNGVLLAAGTGTFTAPGSGASTITFASGVLTAGSIMEVDLFQYDLTQTITGASDDIQYGYSVAVDNGWLAVGVPYRTNRVGNANYSNHGRVELLALNSETNQTVTVTSAFSLNSAHRVRINNWLISPGTTVDQLVTNVNAVTVLTGVSATKQDANNITLTFDAAKQDNGIVAVGYQSDTRILNSIYQPVYSLVNDDINSSLLGSQLSWLTAGVLAVVENYVDFIDSTEIYWDTTTQFDSGGTVIYNGAPQTSQRLNLFQLLTSGRDYINTSADTVQLARVKTIQCEKGAAASIFYTGDLYRLWVGDANSTTENQNVLIYTNNNFVKGWTPIRQQQPSLEPRSIFRAWIYNQRTQEKVTDLDVVDIANGLLPGALAQHIDFISGVDPAVYGIPQWRSGITYHPGDRVAYNGSYYTAKALNVSVFFNADNWTDNGVVGFSNTGGTRWAAEQMGRTWFNTLRLRTVLYEQGDLVNRIDNYNRWFSDTQIVVSEWVASTVPPAEYANTDGTVAADAPYVYDPVTKNYYFWVANKQSVGNKHAVSTSDISVGLNDVPGTGLAMIAPAANNAVILYNVKNYVDAAEYILHIDYVISDHNNRLHSEYLLLSEDGTEKWRQTPIYSKMVDSLSGKDAQGLDVPDTNLINDEKYGVALRPRQSMFRDRLKALQIYFQTVNENLARVLINNQNSLSHIKIKQPSPGPENYKFVVPDRDTLALLNVAEYTENTQVLVTTDATIPTGGWSLLRLVAGEWQFVTTEYYDLSQYWVYTDWSDSSYIGQSANYTLDHIGYLQSILPETGELIEILNNGDGNRAVYRYTEDQSLEPVFIQNGTIQFLPLLSSGYGFDLEPLDAQDGFDADSGQALRIIIRALNEYILTDSLSYIADRAFFAALRYAMQEVGNLEWLFRTSFINVKHRVKNLNRQTNFRNDDEQFVKDFIEENKPYHTRVRDYVNVYSGTDTSYTAVSDFDLPALYDEVWYKAQFSATRGRIQSAPAGFFQTGVALNQIDNLLYVGSTGEASHAMGLWPNSDAVAVTPQDWVFAFNITPVERDRYYPVLADDAIGVAVNGVPFYSVVATQKDSLVWQVDASVEEVYTINIGAATTYVGPDAGNGYLTNAGAYVYRLDPKLLYTKDSTQHSPLLGIALDGFPIYGPYGFANADGTGGIVRNTSSYRLKNEYRLSASQASIVSGTRYADYAQPNGEYIEDWRYTPGLGTLDEHNGRFVITPEYPWGTYAYFVTVDDQGNPAYPYIVGPTFKGEPTGLHFEYRGQKNVPVYQNGRYIMPPAPAIANTDWSLRSPTGTFPNDSARFTETPYVNWYQNYKYDLTTSSQLMIADAGRGYTSAPTITIGGGTGASAVATINASTREIATVTLTNPGYGFTSTPTVTVTGGFSVTNWSATASYSKYDVVYNPDTVEYYEAQDAVVAGTPLSNSTYWTLLDPTDSRVPKTAVIVADIQNKTVRKIHDTVKFDRITTDVVIYDAAAEYVAGETVYDQDSERFYTSQQAIGLGVLLKDAPYARATVMSNVRGTTSITVDSAANIVAYGQTVGSENVNGNTIAGSPVVVTANAITNVITVSTPQTLDTGAVLLFTPYWHQLTDQEVADTHAANRVMHLYKPNNQMLPNDLGMLMDGAEFPGTYVDGSTFVETYAVPTGALSDSDDQNLDKVALNVKFDPAHVFENIFTGVHKIQGNRAASFATADRNTNVQFGLGTSSVGYNTNIVGSNPRYITVDSNTGVSHSPDLDELATGTSTFTLEFFFRAQVLNSEQTLIDTRNNNTSDSGLRIYINASNQIVVDFYTLNNLNVAVAKTISGGSVTTNIWQHVAVERNYNVMRLYLDGLIVGSYTDSYLQNQSFTDTGFTLGSDVTVSTVANVFMDEVRLTRGINRYGGSSYQIPLQGFPRTLEQDSYFNAVTLLYGFEGLTNEATNYDIKFVTEGSIEVVQDLSADNKLLTVTNTNSLITGATLENVTKAVAHTVVSGVVIDGYDFTPSTKTLIITGRNIRKEQLIKIVNVTDNNTVIYNQDQLDLTEESFSLEIDPITGIETVTMVLKYNTTGMNSTDELYIITAIVNNNLITVNSISDVAVGMEVSGDGVTTVDQTNAWPVVVSIDTTNYVIELSVVQQRLVQGTRLLFTTPTSVVTTDVENSIYLPVNNVAGITPGFTVVGTGVSGAPVVVDVDTVNSIITLDKMQAFVAKYTRLTFVPSNNRTSIPAAVFGKLNGDLVYMDSGPDSTYALGLNDFAIEFWVNDLEYIVSADVTSSANIRINSVDGLYAGLKVVGTGNLTLPTVTAIDTANNIVTINSSQTLNAGDALRFVNTSVQTLMTLSDNIVTQANGSVTASNIITVDSVTGLTVGMYLNGTTVNSTPVVTAIDSVAQQVTVDIAQTLADNAVLSFNPSRYILAVQTETDTNGQHQVTVTVTGRYHQVNHTTFNYTYATLASPWYGSDSLPMFVSVERYRQSLRLFVNGAMVADQLAPYDFGVGTTQLPLRIGAVANGYTGKLADLRITNGIARHAPVELFDTVVTSEFTDELEISPTDVIVDGAGFVNSITSASTEEHVDGRVYDTVDIRVFTNDIRGTQTAYRIFQDMMQNVYYYAIPAATTTVLADDLVFSDDTIYLADVTNFPEPDALTNTRGAIFVGGERITYLAIDRVAKTVSQLVRGTLGTSVTAMHAAGSRVEVADVNEKFPGVTGSYGAYCIATANVAASTIIPVSSARRLSAGMTVTGDNIVGDVTIVSVSKKNREITVTSPQTLYANDQLLFGPIVPDQVKPLNHTDTNTMTWHVATWYNAGATTAADGLGLQTSTSEIGSFLTANPALLPINVWKTSSIYAVGDRAEYNGVVYDCVHATGPDLAFPANKFTKSLTAVL